MAKSTLKNRYRAGLNSLWAWAASVDTSLNKNPPDFYSESKLNPGKQKRDALDKAELVKLCGLPLFQGCARPPLIWTEGTYFCQNFFYWSILITLFGGLRPGEIAQLRCRDILDLYHKPHFRFARFSDSDDDGDDDRDRPGANQGKSPSAFRWIPVHPLLIRLGIVDRRDALIDRYMSSKSGRNTLSKEEKAAILFEAGDQWLFPEWKVYINANGRIMWSHSVTKAWGHVAEKFGIDRKGVSYYSARHSFKGFIDDLEGLSERSSLVLTGHSTEMTVHDQYGPKKISEKQSDLVISLDNETIKEMTKVLLVAKEKSERKELIIFEAWRLDARANDEAFQAAMKRKSEHF